VATAKLKFYDFE